MLEWFLIIHLSQGVTTIPMQSREACVAALAVDETGSDAASKCVSTKTGQIISWGDVE